MAAAARAFLRPALVSDWVLISCLAFSAAFLLGLAGSRTVPGEKKTMG